MDKEDGATTPPTKTLKQTTISDSEPLDTMSASPSQKADPQALHDTPTTPPKKMVTPEPAELSTAQNAILKEQITSPKKKRGRDQDDEVREFEEGDQVEIESVVADGTSGAGRSARSGPEKKRPRDASVEPSKSIDPETDVKASLPTGTVNDDKTATTTSETSEPPSDSSKPVFGSALNGKPQTSNSAFASSTFGALADKPSGFAALAGKQSVFGGGSATPVSGFGALASKRPTQTEAPALSAGFGGSMAGTTAENAAPQSGFSGVAKGGFGSLSGGLGSGFGGGFGSGFSTAAPGQKLSSFAASGAPPIAATEKPTKAFGAPESDGEDGSDNDESDDFVASDEEDKVSNAADDKKRPKVSKVPVHDGEEGEATLLQFRAKLFWIESKEVGWKERGVGTLKLNVPKSYVEYDRNGVPLLGSYDPSGKSEEEDADEPEPTAARLIMRQENTHRVVLNTPIIKALKFEEKSSNTAMQIMFTAFEEGKPVNMLLRMSDANAKVFMSEIAAIQREL